jgi:predicted ATP-grasp superfamily ATP-dependent carboligase
MRVLVTDGEQRSALAVVRSLGRAGHEVLVAASSSPSLAAASRHCARPLVLPGPLARPEEFGEALPRAIGEEGVEAVFPVTDASLSVALAVRDRIEEHGALLPFAERSAYQDISDKGVALGRAAEVGIAGPAQTIVSHPDALDPQALDHAFFPAVVKPSRSVVEVGGARRKTCVTYAADPQELRAVLSALDPVAYPVLVQERIEGPGVGIFALLWEGELVAAFAHRRLREKPPSGGVSVLREAAPMDAELLDRSVALLRSFRWRGPAMVEFKVDAGSGTPHLMEVNGRYWGSLQLAVDAGVDFPAIHLDVATGRGRSPVLGYRVGVKTRWLLGDVDHLIARLRHSREALGLPAHAPGRLRAVWDFLSAFRPGIHNEVLGRRDPGPALLEARLWLRSLWGHNKG